VRAENNTSLHLSAGAPSILIKNAKPSRALTHPRRVELYSASAGAQSDVVAFMQKVIIIMVPVGLRRVALEPVIWAESQVNYALQPQFS
jgi:hypothetical protein